MAYVKQRISIQHPIGMTAYQQQHIQRAILAGLEYYQGVKLPSPQTTGTATQQQAYAWQKAEEVQRQINNNG